MEEALLRERSSLVSVAGYDKFTLDVVCLFGSGYAGLGLGVVPMDGIEPPTRGCSVLCCDHERSSGQSGSYRSGSPNHGLIVSSPGTSKSMVLRVTNRKW